MLFREGDRVTLTGVVRGDQEPGETSVAITIGAGKGYKDVVVISDTSALKLVVAQFRIGDKVRMKVAKQCGTVLALRAYGDGSSVLFTEMDDGSICTLHGDGCELVLPDVPVVAPPSMPAGGIGSWVPGFDTPVPDDDPF